MAKILHRDIFWFFLRDKEFISRTISDGSVDLDKFPAEQSMTASKKARKLKSNGATHQTSIRGAPCSSN